jgi:predicted RNase H-like nuclease (RuvC/YqgF family)
MGKGMEAIIVGVVGAVAAIVVQTIGFVLNRRSGLSEAQEAYQGTLEGMNKAMSTRVADLEKIVDRLSKQNEALEEKVEDLERQVRELTAENLELRRAQSVRQ